MKSKNAVLIHGRSLAVLTLISVCAAANADTLEQLPYAFSGGTPSLDLRLRYENVDQQNALKNAYATTFRTRLGYDTGKWNDFDIYGEYEGTGALFSQDYNSTVNGKTDHSTIGDPQDTRLNQAFVRYSGLPKTVIKLGRQRIKLDNDRFVGNVGWRDAEQTYDGYNLTSSWLSPKSTISYTYISNINNVFYTDYPVRGHLINLNYKLAPWLSLTGYSYLLDFKVDSPLRRDTATQGLRATGSIPLGDFTLAYSGEYAHQLKYGDSPANVGALYYLVEPSLSWKFLSGKVGYEVLGSNADGSYGFQTPLATLHVFQGWADLFLNTPKTGIRDLYFQTGAKVEKCTLTAVYHDFHADFGGRKYGTEIDAVVSRPLIKNLSGLVKYASFRADQYAVANKIAVNTKKFWVELDYAF
jgi:hypothetical protein